jgi:hypothetical protein
MYCLHNEDEQARERVDGRLGWLTGIGQTPIEIAVAVLGLLTTGCGKGEVAVRMGTGRCARSWPPMETDPWQRPSWIGCS